MPLGAARLSVESDRAEGSRPSHTRRGGFGLVRPVRHAAGGMTGICAKETAGVDVNLPLQIATLDASIGRKVRLQGSPREGPEVRAKAAVHCEREIGFSARSEDSSAYRGGLRPNRVRLHSSGISALRRPSYIRSATSAGTQCCDSRNALHAAIVFSGPMAGSAR